MEIVEAKREAIEPFLEREWRGVNLEQFGRADSEMWKAQEYALAAYEGGEMVGALVFKIAAGGENSLNSWWLPDMGIRGWEGGFFLASRSSVRRRGAIRCGS